MFDFFKKKPRSFMSRKAVAICVKGAHKEKSYAAAVTKCAAENLLGEFAFYADFAEHRVAFRAASGLGCTMCQSIELPGRQI